MADDSNDESRKKGREKIEEALEKGFKSGGDIGDIGGGTGDIVTATGGGTGGTGSGTRTEARRIGTKSAVEQAQKAGLKQSAAQQILEQQNIQAQERAKKFQQLETKRVQREIASQKVGTIQRVTKEGEEISYIGIGGKKYTFPSEQRITFKPEQDIGIRGGSSRIEVRERLTQTAKERFEKNLIKEYKKEFKERFIGTIKKQVRAERVQALTKRIELGKEKEEKKKEYREIISEVEKKKSGLDSGFGGFFGKLVKTGGEISKKTGTEEFLLGEKGTGEPILTIGKTSLQVLDIPFDIAKKDIYKIKGTKAYKDVMSFFPKEEKKETTTFGDVLDIKYKEGISFIEKKSVYFKRDKTEQKIVDVSLSTLKRLKPSELITEAGLLYITGKGAATLLKKSPLIVGKVIKMTAPILTTAIIGTVGVEVALAPEEERVPILFQRGIQFYIGAKFFELGLKSKPAYDFAGRFKTEIADYRFRKAGIQIEEPPRRYIEPKPKIDRLVADIEKGKPFISETEKRYIPLKVGEVEEAGKISSIFKTVKFEKRPIGFDISTRMSKKGLYLETTERQLALAKGGRDIIQEPKISIEGYRKLGERLSNKKLLEFGFKKPVTEPEAYLLRVGGRDKPFIQARLSKRYKDTTEELLIQIKDYKKTSFKDALKEMFGSKRASAIGKLERKKDFISLEKRFIQEEKALKGFESEIRKPKLNIKDISEVDDVIFFSTAGLSKLRLDEKTMQEERRRKLYFLPEKLRFDLRIKPRVITEPKIKIDLDIDEAIKPDLIIPSITILDIPEPIIPEPIIPEPKEPRIPEPEEPIKEKVLPKLRLDIDFKIAEPKPSQGYNAYAIFKGRRTRLNKVPLPENKAFNVVSEFVDNTSSIKGSISKSRKDTRERDTFYRRAEFKFTKSKDIYTEKPKYRKDTIQERGLKPVGFIREKKIKNRFF